MPAVEVGRPLDPVLLLAGEVGEDERDALRVGEGLASPDEIQPDLLVIGGLLDAVAARLPVDDLDRLARVVAVADEIDVAVDEDLLVEPQREVMLGAVAVDGDAEVQLVDLVDDGARAVEVLVRRGRRAGRGAAAAWRRVRGGRGRKPRSPSGPPCRSRRAPSWRRLRPCRRSGRYTPARSVGRA